MNEIEVGKHYQDERGYKYRCDAVVTHAVPMLPMRVIDSDESFRAAVRVAVCRHVSGGGRQFAGRFYFFMDGQRVGNNSSVCALVRETEVNAEDYDV
jgi:hypothetical protein